MNKTLLDLYDEQVAAGTLQPDPAQLAVLPVLETLRVYLETAQPTRGLRGLFSKLPTPPKSLYIWGGVGRGKSMLMDMFVDAVAAPKRRVHFHAFMQEIHAGLKAAREQGVEDALKPVADAVSAELRLLAFDEMQISDITDAMLVGRLFEALFAAGVTIVTTSNRPPEDLYKDGLNRALFLPFIDMLNEKMDVHHLKSDSDYRRDMLSGSPVYFSPVTPDTRAAIDGMWRSLVGNDESALTLKVNGREVELPRYGNGVARAEFWDLCGKPLGPADYLELSKAVRVLILENVPRLGRSNFNEARRFVTLIDALYEAHVRLIMSAADVPDQLYVEGEGTFEFARTASRLIEMQSDAWAAQVSD